MYMRIRQYSDHSGLPEDTVRKYCKDGTIPAMRKKRGIYQVDAEAADAALRALVQHQTDMRRRIHQVTIPEMVRISHPVQTLNFAEEIANRRKMLTIEAMKRESADSL